MVLVLKGYLTKFSTVYKGYQMRLGLKDLTMCIALAMAFAYKYQCFTIKKYKFFPMRLGHIRPFKVMAMTPLRLAKFAYKKFIFYFYCLQRCIGQFGLKNASGQ